MSKPSSIPFKPLALDFDRAEAAANQVSRTHNIPSHAFPQSETREGEKPTPALRPTQRIPVYLPDYVVTDIKQRALDAKTSQRFIIMQALRQGGIAIDDMDMIEDGRRVR
jgi:hypothetical protein